MNIQAMMKQAQKLQKDMLNAKSEIDSETFESRSSFLTIKANGKREILEVKIDKEMMDNDDIEMLQDMIQVTVNDIMKKIEIETENKMGKYTQGMPGLF